MPEPDSYPRSLQVLIVTFENPPQFHVAIRHCVEKVRASRLPSVPLGRSFRDVVPAATGESARWSAHHRAGKPRNIPSISSRSATRFSVSMRAPTPVGRKRTVCSAESVRKFMQCRFRAAIFRAGAACGRPARRRIQWAPKSRRGPDCGRARGTRRKKCAVPQRPNDELRRQ